MQVYLEHRISIKPHANLAKPNHGMPNIKAHVLNILSLIFMCCPTCRYAWSIDFKTVTVVPTKPNQISSCPTPKRMCRTYSNQVKCQVLAIKYVK
jgi:hypothetical protein